MTFRVTRGLLDAWNNGTLAETAYSMARHGFPVFPCEPCGKRPLTANGLYGASTDLDIVSAQWKRTPKANIGFPIPAGLAVGDFDDLDQAERLEERYGRFTSPVAQRTSSGAHLFWTTSVEIRNSAGKIAPGFDIRGVGGYVIVPSSQHQTGAHYEWIDIHSGSGDDLAPSPMPQWIVDRLAPPTPFRPAAGPVVRGERPTSESFGEGKRNDGLTRIAGSLRRQGCDEITILATLETVNQRQCNPPLPDSEVARIASSVARYAPAAPTPIRLPRPRPVILLGQRREGA